MTAGAPRFLPRDPRPELAEALGVFALVFIGCGAIMVNARTGQLGDPGIALAFGLVIATMVYGLGHVSGAHFNPAITVAFAASGHFPWRRVPTYAVAQVAGGTAGALSLRLLLGPVADLGATGLAPGLGAAQAFVLEVVATFFLALVIIGVATDRRAAPGAAGLAIGLTVAMGSLVVGPLTGASMNPARSLGPAIVADDGANLWLYLLAPFVGAVLGMLAYEVVRGGHPPAEAEEPLGVLGPVSLDGPMPKREEPE